MGAAMTEGEAAVLKMLAGARALRAEGNMLVKQLAECDALIRAAGSAAREGGRTGAGHSATGRQAAEQVLLWHKQRRREMMERLRALREGEKQLGRLMEALPSMQAMILRLRWHEGKRWTAVARAVYVSERQAQRLQRAAIADMARRLGA
ncbi:MAG: hypothetical protein GX558_03355 [Clostridiales bacterium]|nr:hypothetical protein [Clostridiales bacterium]